jgi:hypothetical protein
MKSLTKSQVDEISIEFVNEYWSVSAAEPLRFESER